MEASPLRRTRGRSPPRATSSPFSTPTTRFCRTASTRWPRSRRFALTWISSRPTRSSRSTEPWCGAPTTEAGGSRSTTSGLPSSSGTSCFRTRPCAGRPSPPPAGSIRRFRGSATGSSGCGSSSTAPGRARRCAAIALSGARGEPVGKSRRPPARHRADARQGGGTWGPVGARARRPPANPLGEGVGARAPGRPRRPQRAGGGQPAHRPRAGGAAGVFRPNEAQVPLGRGAASPRGRRPRATRPALLGARGRSPDPANVIDTRFPYR